MQRLYKYRIPCFLFFIVLLLVTMVQLFSSETSRFQENSSSIAFVLRDSNIENWENMRQGAMQAADDMNASVRFISLDGPVLQTSQTRVLKDEIAGNADALVISPCASTKDIQQALEKLSIPIIMAESNMKDTNYPYIGSDQTTLGEDLGQEIMRHGNYRKKIAIIIEDDHNQSINERLKALENTLKTGNNQVEVLSFGSIDEYSIYQRMYKKDVDVVVSLDRIYTDAVVKGVYQATADKSEDEHPEIYAVGSNSRIISDLENEKIVSTLVSDDFSTGYLAVKSAIAEINREKSATQEDIRYMIVDKEHMYQEDVEKLLFPFIR